MSDIHAGERLITRLAALVGSAAGPGGAVLQVLRDIAQSNREIAGRPQIQLDGADFT